MQDQEDKNSAIRSAEKETHATVSAEWQPIETAPKDGRRVILGTAGQGVCLGSYGPKYSAYGVNYGDSWGDGSAWRDSFEFEPTHWMPLPAPPSLATHNVPEKLETQPVGVSTGRRNSEKEK